MRLKFAQSMIITLDLALMRRPWLRHFDPPVHNTLHEQGHAFKRTPEPTHAKQIFVVARADLESFDVTKVGTSTSTPRHPIEPTPSYGPPHLV